MGSRVPALPPLRGRIAAAVLTILALCSLGLLCPPSGMAAEPGPNIVFLGDSLTAGYGLDNPPAEAYPALIQQKLEAEHLPGRVVNAGLSGDTTTGGLRRLDWVLRQPVDILFVALGGNDGLRGINPELTEKNLERIVDVARAKNPAVKIVIAGMQMPDSMGQTYVQQFKALFGRVAAQKHAVLLPFLLAGVGGHPDLNQADAIHPTAAGHRVVAETVWKTLRPLL